MLQRITPTPASSEPQTMANGDGLGGLGGSCVQGPGGRIISEGDLAFTQVPDHILGTGLITDVDAAPGAPPPLSSGRLGEQQVQGGQVRQDPVLADVGVLEPSRVSRCWRAERSPPCSAPGRSTPRPDCSAWPSRSPSPSSTPPGRPEPASTCSPGPKNRSAPDLGRPAPPPPRPQAADAQAIEFYLRELPPLRAVLDDLSGMVGLLVAGGYADLDPGGRPGLGARAHAEFGIPVIGVAKSRFRTATHAVPVVRGSSARPLFVTAAGMPAADAADLVRRLQDRQGRHAGQDLVFADVQVLRPARIGMSGAGVAVAAPVSGAAVGPRRFQPPPAPAAAQQPGQQVPARGRACRVLAIQQRIRRQSRETAPRDLSGGWGGEPRRAALRSGSRGWLRFRRYRGGVWA